MIPSSRTVVADVLCLQYGGHGFLKRDQRLLEGEFTFDTFEFRVAPLQFLVDCVRCFWWMWRRRSSSKLVFTRFADYHAAVGALFARILGKPFIVVLGGYDAIWMPRYDFGVYRKWKSRFAATYAIRNARFVLPVDESLIRGVNSYSDPEPRMEGILEYIQGIHGTIVTVQNGYDGTVWKVPPGVSKEDVFLTVAHVTTRVEWLRKGINHFVALAERLPHHRFQLVGMDRDVLARFVGRSLPPNLTLLPPLKQPELRLAYSRAMVYVQLSLSEGMPNALCEAMLCECVPVGSKVNGIPGIIGDTGVVVARQDLADMERALLAALTLKTGRQARERIIERFSPERRRIALSEIFRTAIDSPGRQETTTP